MIYFLPFGKKKHINDRYKNTKQVVIEYLKTEGVVEKGQPNPMSL
jgi:hypothetical protein